MAIKKTLILGYFEDPHDLLIAGEEARRLGYSNLDAYSPFPIHGIEEVLGIKKSWVPSVAKTMLVIGAICGFSFQAWISASSWPLNVGGKPLVSWPAFIPITFESAILFCGWATIISVIVSCKLKPGGHRFIDRGFTDDKVALAIPVEENQLTKVIELLKSSGSYEVIKIENN